MSTSFLVAAMATLIYLIYWMITNDRAETIAKHTGLLRMRRISGAAEAEEAALRNAREEVSRRRPKTLRRWKLDKEQLDGHSKEAMSTGGPAGEGETSEAELVHPLYRHRNRKRISKREGK